MHDSRSHPLLEQVPLTVSPFVHLPRAATLPYRYKTMPSALPPSVLGDRSMMADQQQQQQQHQQQQQQPTDNMAKTKIPFVMNPASGAAAHPDDILASCRALREHIARMQADADAQLQAFEERIEARELAEKRRVAPGWLDSEDRLLVPERRGGETPEALEAQEAPQAGTVSGVVMPSEMAVAETSELQRSFGGLQL